MPINSLEALKNILNNDKVFTMSAQEYSENVSIIEKDLIKYDHIKQTLDDYGLEDYLLDEPNVLGHCIDEFYSLVRYPIKRVTLDEEKFIDIIKTHFDLATLYNKCENLTEEEFEICKKIYSHKNID